MTQKKSTKSHLTKGESNEIAELKNKFSKEYRETFNYYEYAKKLEGIIEPLKQEIEQLKQEIVELQHRLFHSDEELTSNSRDFWKAEATKLKSEKAELIKVVEKFKVIDGLDVIINKGDIVIFKKEWELLNRKGAKDGRM